MPLTPLMTEVKRAERIGFWFLIGIAVLILAQGWVGDYRSCLRAQPAREALRQDARIARESVQFWTAKGEPEIAARARERAKVQDVEQLSCLRILPGV